MAYADAVLAKSPRAYYRHGEASGTTMVDASGNSRNGTYTAGITLGATGLITGDPDTAISLPFSVAAHGDVPYAAWMDTPTALTIRAWIKTSRSAIQSILDRDAGADRVWQFRLNGGQLEFIKISGSVVGAGSTGLTLNDGQPHQVGATYDGTNIRLYADGVLVKTQAAAGTLVGASAFTIGANRSSGYVQPFDGTIDETVYLGIVLTDADFASDYLAGTGGIVLPTIQTTRTIYPLTAKVPPEVIPLPTIGAPRSVYPLGVRSSVRTNRGDRYNGLRLRGSAEAFWEPPVDPPPTYDAAPKKVVVAHALNPVLVTDSLGRVHPNENRQEAQTDAYRIRTIVGGKDISYWRSVPTPDPTYRLVEPLLYGSARITLPQFYPAFEDISDHRWMAKDKPVILQLVNTTTNTVVATIYRGFVLDYDTAGSALVLEVGGSLTGRMALDYKPQELFRVTQDIGSLVAFAIRAAGDHFYPWPYVPTGIPLVRPGSTDVLSYVQSILAKAWTVAGDQWTVTRTADDRKWTMALKDTTTIDATVYFDTSRVVPSLRSDLTEQPNRIFAQGITPEGMRVRFGVYPNLIEGTPAAYPFDDGRTFGEGTVDADTDTGDGISVMMNKLMTATYVSVTDILGGYDADATAGIKDLQREAGLPVTGNMDPDTWNALYDIETTGYRIAWSHIEPAAQNRNMGKWRYSASGQVARRNPNWDPSASVVARAIDVGAGFTRQQIRHFAAAMIPDPDTKHWFGTADLNGYALIRGDHTPGDPITAADIMQPGELKPGMNIRAPKWDGGTLFHLSGIEYDGRRWQLALDTDARDTMALWQIIQRNRETRRDPARAWLAEQRQSTTIQDVIYGLDEVGGIIDAHTFPAGQWTVFPTVGGQAGTIRRLRTALAPAEYVIAVFGRQVGRGLLNWAAANPLSAAGTARWEDEAVRERLEERALLYASGTNEQPLGYWPRRKTGDDGDPTGAPLTGLHDDTSQFSYYTFGSTWGNGLLWVAVYVDRDTSIGAGRIMWPQLESGA